MQFRWHLVQLKTTYLCLPSTNSIEDSLLAANQHTLETMSNFLDSNADTSRFRVKLEESYYFREFDSEKDYNLEFIFRQLPTIFNVAESERIGSVSAIGNLVYYIGQS